MLDNIMINPRRMNTIPRWNVVTMDSDLSGGGLTTSSSRVPTLATLCRLVQMMDCPWPPTPTPLSLLILLSLRWCLFSLSILTAIALCMAEVNGILIGESQGESRQRPHLDLISGINLTFHHFATLSLVVIIEIF